MKKGQFQRQQALQTKLDIGSVNRRINQAFAEGQDDATYQVVTMALLVLRDQFGYGRKRLNRFHSNLIELCEAVKGGYLNFDDIRETLLDEVKIVVKEVGK